MLKRTTDRARMKETLDGAIVELNAIAGLLMPERSAPPARKE